MTKRERERDARVAAKAVLDIAYGDVLKEPIPERINKTWRALK